MDEIVKVNFMRPMMVLKIRDVYKAPYHKHKYLSINRKTVEDRKGFIGFLQEFTKTWSSGTYELQFLMQEREYAESNIYSTFIRFDVRDGRVVKLWKLSPYNKREYPIWSYFKPEKEVKVKKKVKKRKRTLKTKKTSSKKKR